MVAMVVSIRKRRTRERGERERERERGRGRQEVTSPSPSTISTCSGLYRWGEIKRTWSVCWLSDAAASRCSRAPHPCALSWWEREEVSVYVRERESKCVCERERESVCVCVRERETGYEPIVEKRACFRVQPSGCKVQGVGFEVQGVGFRA